MPKNPKNNDRFLIPILLLLVMGCGMIAIYYQGSTPTDKKAEVVTTSPNTSTDSSLTWKEDPFESETPLKQIDLEHAVQIIDIMIDGHQVYFIKLNGHVYFLFGESGHTPIHIPDCAQCARD